MKKILLFFSILFTIGVLHAITRIPATSIPSSSSTLDCQQAYKTQFHEAYRCLHSFWYSRAIDLFLYIIQKSPSCAMAHWGVAMCHWYPLWVDPSPEHISAANQSMTLAIQYARTIEELNFMRPLAQFYQSFSIENRVSSIGSYRSMMKELWWWQSKLYDEDDNDDDDSAYLTALYSLANLAMIKAITNTSEQDLLRNETGVILKSALVRFDETTHVGLLHYLIHAYDHPHYAHLALSESRLYSTIAPDIPHALHMPSHTYQHLGSWRHSIESNVRSISSSSSYEDFNYPGQLHSLGFLVHALLQRGQVSFVKEYIDYIQQRPIQFGLIGISEVFDLISIPMKYALETRDWKYGIRLKLMPESPNWEIHSWIRVYQYFAQLVSSLFLQEQLPNGIEQRHDLLLKAFSNGKESIGWPYVPADMRVEIDKMINVSGALVQFVQGNKARALQLLNDSLNHYIHSSEFMIVPLYEIVADLLVTKEHAHREARRIYQHLLTLYPNRLNSLYGVAVTSRALHDKTTAHQFFRQVVSLCDANEMYVCPTEMCQSNGTQYNCQERKEMIDAQQYITKRPWIAIVSGIVLVIIACLSCQRLAYGCLLLRTNKQNRSGYERIGGGDYAGQQISFP